MSTARPRNNKGQFAKMSTEPHKSTALFETVCIGSVFTEPAPARKFLAGTFVYNPRMTYNAYPGCCGAGVGVGFSSIAGAGVTDPVLAMRYLKAEVENIERLAKVSRHGIMSCIVTLAQLQVHPLIHKALCDAGWTVGARSGNPNHDNQTTLFFYYKARGGGAKLTNNDEISEFVKPLLEKKYKAKASSASSSTWL